MKKYWKTILILLLSLALVAVLVSGAGDMITFEALKKNAKALAKLVDAHYLFSVLVFAASMISTAFFVPGALIFTVSGGFLFGAALGSLYAALFSTAGCTLAFLLSRHLIGGWVQKKYGKYFRGFNEEVSRHGPNYLFVLRVVPVMPSFMVNYLAGLTRISVSRFAVATFLGIVPGAVVCSLAGRQLAAIEAPGDIFSGKIIAGFLLLAVFGLLPVLYKRLKK